MRLPDHPLNRPGFAYWPADYWVTLGTSGLLSALSGVILVGLARDLGCGPRRSALVGLAYGLATPAYAYATLAYGHQASAFCLLASFALLWRDGPRPRLRSALAGFLASYASVVEIQVGPVSAILGLYLLALAIGRKRPASAILAFGLGAAVPAAILLTYNYLAFGSPWRMGYFYEVLEQFKDVHSTSNPLGLGRPDWSKLGELLWGERRGLLRFAPILVLTVPGLVVAACPAILGPGVVVDLGDDGRGPPDEPELPRVDRRLVDRPAAARAAPAVRDAAGGEPPGRRRPVDDRPGDPPGAGGRGRDPDVPGRRGQGPRRDRPAPGRGRLAPHPGRSALARLGLRQPIRPEPGEPGLARGRQEPARLGGMGAVPAPGRCSRWLMIGGMIRLVRDGL